nr:hypothetical protein [Candidatus Woesearchaeota archaeon]
MSKGASHIDWAISMGIFIIYIMSLLIFVQPGLEETSDRTILLTILESGFKDYTYHDLEKTPLFINTSSSDGNYKFQIIFNNNFPFTGNEEDFTLTDKDNSQVPFDLNLNANSNMNFDVAIKGNNFKNLFWLLYMQDANYDNLPVSQDQRIILQESNNQFNYKFGTVETISGINQEKLDLLKQETDLRKRFNYPETNGLMINVIDSASFNYQESDIIYIFKTSDPDEENIFVKDIKDTILLKDGTKKEVVINFRVW